ncbi:MAG: DNA alkylation repair protein [Desulfobacteraceae bacterium]|nr:DNA alkylation repair protein [Desulfobacteraceae bacterium]MBU4053070.1 DNA alkylation repair protein [Pseudomonadota bacterium]
MTSLCTDIHKELQNLSDPVMAEHAKRFFKTGKGEYGEGDEFLGIRVPVLRKLAKKHKSVFLPEAEQLLQSPFHEARLLALFLLVGRFNAGDEHRRKQVYDLYSGNTRHINNWDLVDSSAHHIVGCYLFDKDKKPIYDFSRSAHLWERRIAILSTFYFIRNKAFEDALAISLILLKDGQDLIHKAVGWMLREIGNRSLETEISFLDAHYQNMPRTMLRYAIEKFPEPLRLSYLKGTRQSMIDPYNKGEMQ